MNKSTKKDVGKGIRALLANIDKKESISAPIDPVSKGADANTEALRPLSELEITAIEINPYQPRTDFDEQELEELAASIKVHGLIQPITVRRLNAKKYQIISGERRWRASQIAGLKTIPVYIREADDQGMLEMALLENIQRADLNPMEVAISYQRLIDECDLTHDELSERLGKSRSTISNHLRVLKLAPSVQKALKEKTLSLGHAKILAGVEQTERQASLLHDILTKGLSVRATEALIKSQLAAPTKSVPTSSQPQHPEITKMVDLLSESIGTKIQIQRSERGQGNIKILFNSDRELNDIIERILDRE